jgi:hypothetical protein
VKYIGDFDGTLEDYITSLPAVTSIGVGTLSVTASDITLYDATNDGNPSISIGSSATERLEIQAAYESGAQGLDAVRFKTYTAGSATNDGRFTFFVDETGIFQIRDHGINLYAGKSLQIGNADIITDSGGTATLSNIDALDATTESTIESAIDTLGDLTLTGLVIDGNKQVIPGDGAMLHIDTSTITDSATAESGTATIYAHARIEQPTLAATNPSVTTENAATLYISGAPSAGTNQTLENVHSLWVDDGNVRLDGEIYMGTTRAMDSSGLLRVANQSTITGLGTISSGTWQGTVIASAYLDSDTAHLSGTQTFSGTKTFSNTISGSIDGNAATVTSASGTNDANHTLLFTASGAGATTVLQDAGILYNPSSNLLTVGDLTVSGTSTTIGTITSGTWEGTAIATDQQKHLAWFTLKGYGTGDGTNYEIPEIISDTNAPFEHNTSTGSDGLTAQTVQTMMRLGGLVVPRAGTLKKWYGWATTSGSQTANIGLFRVRPTRNDNSNLTPVLLDNVSYTALGNTKMEDFDETSFTDADIAIGDIIYTGIKCQSSKTTYFTSTLEIEWD